MVYAPLLRNTILGKWEPCCAPHLANLAPRSYSLWVTQNDFSCQEMNNFEKLSYDNLLKWTFQDKAHNQRVLRTSPSWIKLGAWSLHTDDADPTGVGCSRPSYFTVLIALQPYDETLEGTKPHIPRSNGRIHFLKETVWFSMEEWCIAAWKIMRLTHVVSFIMHFLLGSTKMLYSNVANKSPYI